MNQVKLKIKKLLALAGSSNEHEAKAALLKARALMAEHKLLPNDLAAEPDGHVAAEVIPVSFTFQSEPTLYKICQMLAEHCCCKIVLVHERHKKKYGVKLVGLQKDFELCKMIVEYGVQSVRAGAARIKAQMKESGADASQIREAVIAYETGFGTGLREALETQTQSHAEWGLVMQTPTVVLDYLSRFQDKKKIKRVFFSPESAFAHQSGYEDGKNFRFRDRLKAKEA